MTATLPDKLIPVRGIERSLLPVWVTDVGTTGPLDGYPSGLFAVFVRHYGELHHCCCERSVAIRRGRGRNWRQLLPVMIDNLGNLLFEKEYPGLRFETYKWEARGEPLTASQQRCISRRNELSWPHAGATGL